MAPSTEPAPPIPVLLLKTKSSPSDAYEELLSAPASDRGGPFDPLFVPVLEHRFDDTGIAQLRDLLVRRQVSLEKPPADGAYGGLIFTSQRAVEAFTRVVRDSNGNGNDDDDETLWPYLQDVPIYSVGPATTRALKAVPQKPPLQVLGEHTGNGEDLAYFIREHYANAQPTPTRTMPPLLFLVGDKRRDIIPKVLMGGGDGGSGGGGSQDLQEPPLPPPPPPPPRIQVDEIVVYGTGVMTSFAEDFQRALDNTQDRPARWVVVFSPTGCDSMLAGLGLLDPVTGKVRATTGSRRTTYIATIGPTTQAYLRNSFGFEPDVCADEPSPTGVLRGITQFMATLLEER